METSCLQLTDVLKVSVYLHFKQMMLDGLGFYLFEGDYHGASNGTMSRLKLGQN